MTVKRAPVSPLGEWLDDYLSQHSLTYTDLSRILECSPAFLSALRNGRKHLSEELLNRLYDFIRSQTKEIPSLVELQQLNNLSGPFVMISLEGLGLAERKRMIRNIYWTTVERTLDR